mmetsp:Transcript_21993/g.33597  ORF Transcript_21993/g.33597 Transcript_21993/m.33597 type:complete len:372 (-) Transcript_21993:343-1458(-)
MMNLENSDAYLSIERRKAMDSSAITTETMSGGSLQSTMLMPAVKQEEADREEDVRVNKRCWRCSLSRRHLRRQSSSSVLHIRKNRLICYIIIGIISTIATVDHLRTFVINERALLTQMGRQRYRTRRRDKNKARFCDETDEPKLWKLFTSGWRSLSTCEEFDLSLRRTKLGDNGVKRLMSQLGSKKYANGKRRGKLRVLNLQRQGITRRGAGYISRWLSADPLEVNADTAHVVDLDRIPTAASASIFINLEGNPIGLLGFKDLQRAVDKARINGIKVVIVGGGGADDSPKHSNLDTQHVVKVGPITYRKTRVAMEPWRLPVPLIKKISGKDRPFVRGFKIVVVLFVGFAIGRTTAATRLPYRLAIVRNDVQ